jgi:hypothetical protein
LLLSASLTGWEYLGLSRRKRLDRSMKKQLIRKTQWQVNMKGHTLKLNKAIPLLTYVCCEHFKGPRLRLQSVVFCRVGTCALCSPEGRYSGS